MMIIKFQLYEKLNQGVPEEGDYVICEPQSFHKAPEIKEYLSHSIGRINRIGGEEYHSGRSIESDHLIYFTDIPQNKSFDMLNFFDFKRRDKNDYSGEFNIYCKFFNSRNIIYWSKDKKDLERLLKTNKYRL